jgi:Domain of unknown function (DUF4157)
MSQSTVKADRAATPGQAPARAPQPAEALRPTEQAQEAEQTLTQRAVGALGASSPQAQPSDFNRLLGQLDGAASAQAEVLRQLQRRYGNSYVGRVIRCKVAENRPHADDRAGKAQLKGASQAAAPVDGAMGQLESAAGQPLDPPTRTWMESRFGRDFADVRVHQDESAAQAARALRAHAFTIGPDIYFGAGRFQPDAGEGRKLLAHELTHVVQQRSGAGTQEMAKPVLSEPEDASELEAESVARRLAGPGSTPGDSRRASFGWPPPLARQSFAQASPAALIQRDDDKNAPPAAKPTADGADKKSGDEKPAKSAVSAAHEDTLTSIRNILEQSPAALSVNPTISGVARLPRLWQSFGADFPQVASENFDLWQRSVEVWPQTMGIPALEPVKSKFKSDVKNIALGYLAKNEEYARAELARFGLKEGMTPPPIPPAYAQVPGLQEQLPDDQLKQLQQLQNLANRVIALQDRLAELRKVPVGLAGEPFNPAQPPIEDFKIGDLTTWERAKLGWDQANSLITTIINNVPTLYAALSMGREHLQSIAKTDPKKDRYAAVSMVRVMMSAILNNISNARVNINSDNADYRDFKPIHAQLFAGAGDKQWSDPFYKSIARDEIKSHEEAEFWIKLGLEAAAFAALVVAELTTMGAATFFITAAAGLAKVAMAEQAYGAIAAAGQTQLQDDTAIVSKEQVMAAKLAAESERINALTSLLLLGVGKFASPALAKVIAPAAEFGATAEGALSLGAKVRVNVLTGIVIGVPSGMMSAAAASLPALSRGDISADAFLAKIGWGAFMGGAMAGVQAAVGTALSHALAASRLNPPSTALARTTPSDLALPPGPPGKLAPPERVSIDFGSLPPTPERAGPPALPGPGGPPQLPAPEWTTRPPQVDTESGEIVQMMLHVPTNEVFVVRFNTKTGNGTFTHMATGEYLPISGGRLQLPAPGGLLPPGPTAETPPAATSTTTPPETTPGAPPASGLPGAETRTPALPGRPGLPMFEPRPEYPMLPAATQEPVTTPEPPPPPPPPTPEEQAIAAAAKPEDYLAAVRKQPQPEGSVGRSWDYSRFPKAPKGAANQWKPGDPIDMPDAKGQYPTFDTARSRYWRNRAHFELEARARGAVKQDATNPDDPIRVLSDAELRSIRDTGKTPRHPTSNRKMELEHSGVPQRVEKWLGQLGFSASEARRIAQVSNPQSLLEVDPLQHAFFDAIAESFGAQRADVAGVRWSGTQAADVRLTRPLAPMSDAQIMEIAQSAVAKNYNFNKNDATRRLRDALLAEIILRQLPITLGPGKPPSK